MQGIGRCFSVGATHAVLIGIETYQKQGISSVQFAQADAAAMKDLLVQDLEREPRTSLFGSIPKLRSRCSRTTSLI